MWKYFLQFEKIFSANYQIWKYFLQIIKFKNIFCKLSNTTIFHWKNPLPIYLTKEWVGGAGGRLASGGWGSGQSCFDLILEEQCLGRRFPSSRLSSRSRRKLSPLSKTAWPNSRQTNSKLPNSSEQRPTPDWMAWTPGWQNQYDSGKNGGTLPASQLYWPFSKTSTCSGLVLRHVLNLGICLKGCVASFTGIFILTNPNRKPAPSSSPRAETNLPSIPGPLNLDDWPLYLQIVKNIFKLQFENLQNSNCNLKICRKYFQIVKNIFKLQFENLQKIFSW